MAEQDPFQDHDFRERLGKLLRLLPSDQPGEAEAARGRLLAHLEHHGASFSDLADRLVAPPAGHASPSAEALSHAEQRAARAEIQRDQAEAMVRRLAGPPVAKTDWRLWGLAAAAVAGWGAASVSLLTRPARTVTVSGTPRTMAPDPALATGPPPPRESGAMFSAGGIVREVRSGWTGEIIVQAASLQETPQDGAPARALLPRGAKVGVLGSVRPTGSEWLEVHSDSGDGFVRARDVRRTE